MSIFSKRINLCAPIDGKLINLEDVSDEMFSQKLLGDGFAIEPEGDIVKCPTSGKVVMMSENGYAFGIQTKKGVDVLVHIGIDTVNLKGKGFSICLKEGQIVNVEDTAVKLDINYLKQQPYAITTMVVVTSGEKVEHIISGNKNVLSGEIVATV